MERLAFFTSWVMDQVLHTVSAISVPASSQLISPAIFTCQGNKKIKQLYGNCDFELKNGSGFYL